MPFSRQLLPRAMPSSPSSVTMSVAPNSVASFWREVVALSGYDAPGCPVPGGITRTADAPHPTTATVELGFHP